VSTFLSVELRVRGVVQGVGFRPFIHRLAIRHRLSGWVRNESGMVRIRAMGGAEDVESFIEDLPRLVPPLTRLDSLEVDRDVDPPGVEGFVIRESSSDQPGRLPISPDVALCPSCAAELLDPGDRRYGYPFITCTDCGPRFTVIEEMPYDRARTSMRVFPQCPACAEEYGTPGDRRYHSETNSCAECGPGLWFEVEGREPTRGVDAALEAAATTLLGGGVLGVRGLGGFHLAADATDPGAVATLRHRKGRKDKPLAVMVASAGDAALLGTVGPAEQELLESAERPIVLLESRKDSGLAPGVAPGMGSVGVMLAYTPLHVLLSRHVGRPLVMTSGNASEEPIATGNEEARRRLGPIVDGLLLHDREIVARYDDSLVRVVDGAPVFLRRARGYAPLPLGLPVPAPVPLLAVGPHLKNTFTLVHGDSAFVSQHIGDLENLETLEHFNDSLARFRVLFDLQPECVVADAHPGYLTTRVAEEMARQEGLRRLPPVQHHHAHIAAVMAEHGRLDPVLGVSFDGTGWGPDNAVWGGEFLLADLVDFRRLGHLDYAPLPGGDLAARLPWRSALGYLDGVEDPPAGEAREALLATVPETEAAVAVQQLRQRINCPVASSMGRLFDAAAALAGVRLAAHFEGQAPMELEALAGTRKGIVLPDLLMSEVEGAVLLDPRPLLLAVAQATRRGDPVAQVAAGFHDAVVRSTVRGVRSMADGLGVETVALGGGVFQNRRMLSGIAEGLRGAGLEVLTPRRLSPNDGGISYGQAAVAAARLAGLPSAVGTPMDDGRPASDGSGCTNPGRRT
jgi:hydrogenase maturation protein HypF